MLKKVAPIFPNRKGLPNNHCPFETAQYCVVPIGEGPRAWWVCCGQEPRSLIPFRCIGGLLCQIPQLDATCCSGADTGMHGLSLQRSESAQPSVGEGHTDTTKGCRQLWK